jgi:hypothetical protein
VTLNGVMCWHAPCKKSQPADCSAALLGRPQARVLYTSSIHAGEVLKLARLIQSIH